MCLRSTRGVCRQSRLQMPCSERIWLEEILLLGGKCRGSGRGNSQKIRFGETLTGRACLRIFKKNSPRPSQHHTVLHGRGCMPTHQATQYRGLTAHARASSWGPTQPMGRP